MITMAAIQDYVEGKTVAELEEILKENEPRVKRWLML